MSENRSGSSSTWGAIILAMGLALGGALLLAIYLIGSETLRTLGFILVVAIALAVVIGASALPIRAWKRRDFTGDHFHTDGTKTIVKEVRVLDGRAPAQTDIKLLQMPAQPPAGAFPDILRAAYRAGATTLPARSASAIDPGYTEAEIDELDLSSPTGWDGDITG